MQWPFHPAKEWMTWTTEICKVTAPEGPSIVDLNKGLHSLSLLLSRTASNKGSSPHKQINSKEVISSSWTKFQDSRFSVVLWEEASLRIQVKLEIRDSSKYQGGQFLINSALRTFSTHEEGNKTKRRVHNFLDQDGIMALTWCKTKWTKYLVLFLHILDNHLSWRGQLYLMWTRTCLDWTLTLTSDPQTYLKI